MVGVGEIGDFTENYQFENGVKDEAVFSLIPDSCNFSYTAGKHIIVSYRPHVTSASDAQ